MTPARSWVLGCLTTTDVYFPEISAELFVWKASPLLPKLSFVPKLETESNQHEPYSIRMRTGRLGCERVGLKNGVGVVK